MPEAAPPAIRVFVSSTFRDMAAEREELVKFVFPQLRKLCEERGVTWGEVDLRYGISEEQAAEGQVLPILLGEIARSRPYFIGLLGERYGWVPDEIPPELVEQEPWLAEHAGRSVIELEFLHGALRNPEMAEHAFFYLRDPAYVETVPEAERDDYRETDPALAIRLAALKQRIRDSGLPVREEYHDPGMLGALVLADFAALIDSLFPAGSEPELLQRQSAEREAFAASRGGVYIGRKDADTMAETAAPGQPQQRAIRVFVSSTFRDMAAEREELVKFVFPQLRKLCEERGVTWGEVDLRWGITDEQAAEGQVLPICLAEITRSRPYFIGLLGERYGWVPDEIPAELVEQEPWLVEHLDHSVTELEILHGVLNDPEMAQHAFFYLRDPAFLETLPEARRGDYREADEGLADKLAALKERIRGSGFPVRDDYPDPQGLGRLVLDDLTALIERLYPAGSVPTPLQRQSAEQEAFAASRAGVYIGRDEYFERLDAHADGEGPPLVVLGESGSGKSALLANWALHYRVQRPDEPLLMHFVGASPASIDWAGMLRRLMGELKERLAIELDIPDSAEELRPAFANLLHRAAAKSRVVLLIDALNQLEDREGARELLWLPPQIPAGVRLVLSTLPGAPLDEAAKRGWPTLAVEPLQDQERKQLIHDYLAPKRLSDPRTGRLAAAPQTANPLYLRALLEELRVWGQHETLDERIDHYLAAAGAEELYALILERYEGDYDRDRPGLVRDAMAYIWAARRGLSEAELLDLLGTDGEPLPRALWSPLYLAAEQSLVNRAGLLTCFHDYLREAVRRRYVPAPVAQAAVHLRLADYFDSEDRRLLARGIDELPWQLAEAESWQRLYDLLADLLFLEAAWGMNKFEIKSRWAAVEQHSDLRLVDAYRPVTAAPQRLADDHVWMVAQLLGDSGHPTEALDLWEHLVDRYREVGDLAHLQAALGNQGHRLWARGQPDEAMALLEEKARICRELADPAGLAHSLSDQAVILTSLGEFATALNLLDEGERICRQIGDQAHLARLLSNQANILGKRGDLDGALVLYREAERTFRQESDLASVAASLGNQATALWTQGDLDGAMALHKETERICRQLGDVEGLQASLGNQALILEDRGDLDGAMSLHKETELICRQLGDQASLARSLGNQARILQDWGDLSGAMALHKEAEQICRQVADLAGLALSLGEQAVVLQDSGDLDGAMSLHKEEERIARQLGDPEVLQASLSNQALILQNRGDLDGAMALHKETERICRQLGNPEGLAISLTNQASLLGVRMGRRREALPLVAEAYEVATQHGLTALARPIRQLLDGLRQG